MPQRLQEEVYYRPLHKVMAFICSGTKPTFTLILQSHPTIVFEQLFSDLGISNLKNGHTTIVESGEQHFRNCSTINCLQVSFGFLGATLTIENESQFIHAGLTLGYVVGDFGTSLGMAPNNGNEKLTLRTLGRMRKILGRTWSRCQGALLTRSVCSKFPRFHRSYLSLRI